MGGLAKLAPPKNGLAGLHSKEHGDGASKNSGKFKKNRTNFWDGLSP
jgi:hypothetical protein